MPKATVKIDTFLKVRPISASTLTNAEKLFMGREKVFAVTEYSSDRNQHIRMTLASPLLAKDGITKLVEVYAYDPHVEIEGEADVSRVIKLPVIYRSQLDNDTAIFGSGSRQCNTTSNTILADYLLNGDLSKQAKAQGYSEPESLYMRIVGKYGDTTDHDAQTKGLRELGIESYFSYTLSGKDVLRSLVADVPVVVGFAYKGSGHICVVVGHDPIKKAWLVHDPYGSRHGYSDSYDIGIGGKFDPYTYGTMQQIFWDQGGEAGWGRIVTSVKGKPTGLPTGL